MTKTAPTGDERPADMIRRKDMRNMLKWAQAWIEDLDDQRDKGTLEALLKFTKALRSLQDRNQG